MFARLFSSSDFRFSSPLRDWRQFFVSFSRAEYNNILLIDPSTMVVVSLVSSHAARRSFWTLLASHSTSRYECTRRRLLLTPTTNTTSSRSFGITVVQAPPAPKEASSALSSKKPLHLPSSDDLNGMPPQHKIFMEPIHILGAGAMGLLLAASIRTAFPSYPVQLLLRDPYRHSAITTATTTATTTMTTGSNPGSSPSPIPSLPPVVDHNGRPSVTVCLAQAAQPAATTKTRATSPRQTVVHVPAQTVATAVMTPLVQANIYNRKPIRNLILTTKAYQAVAAVESMLPRLQQKPNEDTDTATTTTTTNTATKATNLIVLCNGALAVRDELQSLLERHHATKSVQVWLGTTTHGAFRPPTTTDENDSNDRLYHVVHAGVGHVVLPIELAPMAALLDRAGLHCSTTCTAAMETALWHKLAANCVINPLTALHGCSNGDLLLLLKGDWNEWLDKITREVAAVAAANHAATSGQLDDDDQLSVASLQAYVHQVVTDTAANKSSMWQDVLAKRPTEIGYLSGYVVERGRALGVDCPVNAQLYQQVRALTERYN